MPDSAVVARGRKKAATRPAVRRKANKVPFSETPAPRRRQAKTPRLVDEPRYADVGEVAVFAQDLPEKFLHCRELGHQWKPWSARYVEESIERILRCPRCRCERHQILTLSGAVYSNKYVHPKGYLHEGMGRIIGEGRDVLRMESIKRTIRGAEGKVA